MIGFENEVSNNGYGSSCPLIPTFAPSMNEKGGFLHRFLERPSFLTWWLILAPSDMFFEIRRGGKGSWK
jgi:hypothetical protein